ncbi:MAG: hypothetical protein IPL53_21235 [Ignavibacteria bacterium]|nr:hypothetical protein [Ignavibacteria bacterium]
MAKHRYINTHFWKDNYIINLDPTEKLVYLYLLTNPLTNIAGIYEINLKEIANDTGIIKEIIDTILKRFERDNKLKYCGGYIIIKNHLKHQDFKSPKLQSGIADIINSLPTEILEASITYIYGMDTLSHLIKSNSIKSNPIKSNPNPLTDGFFEEKSKENSDEYFNEYFEKWWKFYPRKEGKNQAKECLRNENLSEADFKKLFQATRNYNESVNDREVRFIKAPMNFIPVWKDFL